MSFDLAYPLGGEEQENYLRFERIIMLRVPPWLRRTIGGAILQGMARVMDALVYRAGYGVRLRFPFVDEDSLSLQGRERRMVRGPAEALETYGARVQGWLDAHRQRGSVYALLEQFRAYFAAAPRAVDVLYHSGTLYKLYENPGLPIDRAIIGWQPEGDEWAQAWIFLFADSDPTPVSAATDAELSLIPRLWNAGHMLPLHVVLVWPGARLWDYPDPDLTWDEQEALYTWDQLVPHRVM